MIIFLFFFSFIFLPWFFNMYVYKCILARMSPLKVKAYDRIKLFLLTDTLYIKDEFWMDVELYHRWQKGPYCPAEIRIFIFFKRINIAYKIINSNIYIYMTLSWMAFVKLINISFTNQRKHKCVKLIDKILYFFNCLCF